jgi:hypothetical protein
LGLAVYTEDQNHQRVYAGKEAGVHLESILQHVDANSILADVHPHGDTMFNCPQLMRIIRELDRATGRSSQIVSDVAAFKSLLEEVLRRRGYVWISGD